MTNIESQQKICLDISKASIKLMFCCNNLIVNIKRIKYQLQYYFSEDTVLNDQYLDQEGRGVIDQGEREELLVNLETIISATRQNRDIKVDLITYAKFYGQVFEKLTDKLITDSISIVFQVPNVLYAYLNNHLLFICTNEIEIEMQYNYEPEFSEKLIGDLQNILDICFALLEKGMTRYIDLYNFPYVENYFISERISALRADHMIELTLDGQNPGKITRAE